MKNEKINSPLDILMVIIDAAYEEVLVPLLEKNDVTNYIHLAGRGTAESELSELFGFGIKNREVFLCLVKSEKSEELLEILNNEIHFDIEHQGLAFTIPLNSAEKELLKLFHIKLGGK